MVAVFGDAPTAPTARGHLKSKLGFRMDQVYNDYFEQRIGQLKEGEPARLAASPEVREIANTAVAAARDVAPLTSDAEVLLDVLATEFVGAPLLTTGASTSSAREMVAVDARTIAETAREFADADGLSAHSVITALDRTWRTLQTAQLNIWG
jgi:hypothetical protein